MNDPRADVTEQEAIFDLLTRKLTRQRIGLEARTVSTEEAERIETDMRSWFDDPSTQDALDKLEGSSGRW